MQSSPKPTAWKSGGLKLLSPQWAESAPRTIGAAMSTRHGGVSKGPWASLNLGGACGDAPDAVHNNRQIYTQALGARPVWLKQVHGTTVLRLGEASPIPTQTQPATLPTADAAWTSAPGVACAVLVADCLPVLFTTRDGRAVAAAHAGWRGLAAGVLQSTVAAMQQGADVQPDELLAWLGPCIGPQVFEVGPDVLQAFGRPATTLGDRCFVRRVRPDGSPRWLCHLPALAMQQLQQVGVLQAAITVAGHCTVSNASDFFSFRRDGVTGRLAAAIWRCR